MNIISVLLIVFIIIYITKTINTRKNKYYYIKAGKKWERIVKELSERK